MVGVIDTINIIGTKVVEFVRRLVVHFFLIHLKINILECILKFLENFEAFFNVFLL